MLAIRMIALAFAAYTASARATQPIELQPLLKQRALGYILMAFENKVARQARLVYDGSNYRLILAGLPPMIMDPKKARVIVKPHPRGQHHVTIYEWDDPRYPQLIQIMVREQPVLELENDALYGGAKHQLPTFIVMLPNRETGLVEIQGGLYHQGQDDRDLKEMIDSLKAAGGTYISMRDSDNELCGYEMEKLRIKVWR